MFDIFGDSPKPRKTTGLFNEGFKPTHPTDQGKTLQLALTGGVNFSDSLVPDRGLYLLGGLFSFVCVNPTSNGYKTIDLSLKYGDNVLFDLLMPCTGSVDDGISLYSQFPSSTDTQNLMFTLPFKVYMNGVDSLSLDSLGFQSDAVFPDVSFAKAVLYFSSISR